VAPIEALAAPLSSLTSLENQGDPFLGARAQVLGVGVESSASTLVAAQSRLSSKKVVVAPQIDVRAIPASEFTVFALGTAWLVRCRTEEFYGFNRKNLCSGRHPVFWELFD